MDSKELFQLLSQIRDIACTVQEYHLQSRLCPALQASRTAPESRWDNRSDIYCLGLILSRQLAGRDLPPEAARILQNILPRTLSPQPRGRYSCCEELVEDLDRALSLLHPDQRPADSS